MILDVLIEAVECTSAAHRHSSCAAGRKIRATARASVSPLCLFDLQLLAALGGERVELGAAIVLRSRLLRP